MRRIPFELFEFELGRHASFSMLPGSVAVGDFNGDGKARPDRGQREFQQRLGLDQQHAHGEAKVKRQKVKARNRIEGCTVPSSEAHGLGNLRTRNSPGRAGRVFQAIPIPHRCNPFDLSNCARAHQELRQDPPHLFQRARVLRGMSFLARAAPRIFFRAPTASSKNCRAV